VTAREQVRGHSACPDAVAAAENRLRGHPARVRRTGDCDVLAEAERRSRERAPQLDATDIPLVTLDPGERDLDQAVHCRRDGGYGSATRSPTSERSSARTCSTPRARRRGQRSLQPTRRTPLHPASSAREPRFSCPTSCGPPSLRPRLERRREPSRQLRRAAVRSRRSWTTRRCRGRPTRPAPEPSPSCPSRPVARAAGTERCELSSWAPRNRSGGRAGRRMTLALRVTAGEGWNAQISLLTGAAPRHSCSTRRRTAADDVPGPPEDVQRLRLLAPRSGWTAPTPPGGGDRGVDPQRPGHAASGVSRHPAARSRLHTLRRLAADQPLHSGVAAAYAQSPRRCVGWSTASAPRSCSRSAPTRAGGRAAGRPAELPALMRPRPADP
jgi:hypothetical protein